MINPMDMLKLYIIINNQDQKIFKKANDLSLQNLKSNQSNIVKFRLFTKVNGMYLKDYDNLFSVVMSGIKSYPEI